LDQEQHSSITVETQMSRSYSILLSEPSPLLREKIAGVLARDKRIWSVTQVNGRGGLVRGASRIQPDFILADLVTLNDPETLRFVRRNSPVSRIIALVDSLSKPYLDASGRIGLDGTIERGRVEEGILAEILLLDEAEEVTRGKQD
jgi:DNA-binding NarL/FixJ family response regulator